MSAVSMTRAHATALLDETACKRIDREVAKYPPDQKQSAVMAALAIAQDTHPVLTTDVVEAIASYLSMAPIAVHEVATFYNMYQTRAVGRFKVAVCTCLPCELRDGAKAGEYLKSQLGIDYNETTADGLFTLVESECMGSCGDSPVMLVNNKRMCSFMNVARMDALIAELRAEAGRDD